MEFNDIITAICTVGFPIVAYGALFWYVLKKDSEHRSEVEKMTEAINNNTIALTKLIERLDNENKKV